MSMTGVLLINLPEEKKENNNEKSIEMI